MISAWKELVLKWLNCFGLEPVKTIKDTRERNFLTVLSPVSITEVDPPFKQLLSYLHDHYPHYDTLPEFDDETWTKDDELFIISTLLLLHASIYHPSATFQQNAAETLNAFEQKLIVTFLQKAMIHEHLTRQTLIACIPTSEDTEGSVSQKHLHLSPSPLPNKRHSGGTPLAEFLSSPIARQKRRSGGVRDRMHSLESDLELEQAEKIELEEQVKEQQTQISDLVKKFQEKSDEVKTLQEDLRRAEETHQVLAEENENVKAEKRKLYRELSDSEMYVAQVEAEVEMRKAAEMNLQQKLTVAEEKSYELEAVMNVTREELQNLKEKMSQQAEENVELQLKCAQLERDFNQMQVLSPRRPSRDSLNRTPSLSPAPESLAFIVEREMIVKENENVELQNNLKDLSDELDRLKIMFTELQERSSINDEAALRSKKKMEIKIENLQKSFDASSQELSLCKREKEELYSKLSDVAREKESLGMRVEEIISEKRALLSEHKTLHDAKHSLEVKVAQLDAKQRISEEREKELHELAKRRLCEVSNMKQSMDDMEVALKKSMKEQEIIEHQLNETKKKLNLAKNLELERNDLEDQVTILKQQNNDLERQSLEASTALKTLERKLQAQIDEKKAIETQLQDINLKRHELASSLHELTVEKSTIASENIALLKDKVCWEADLKEAVQNVNEMREQVAKEVAEKKSVQDKLAEALARNDVLASNLSISTQQENDLSNNLKETLKQKKSVENQLCTVMKEKDRLELTLRESSSELEKVDQERDYLRKKLADEASEMENISSNLSVLLNGKVNLEAQLAEEKAENVKLQAQLSGVMLKLELAQSELTKLKGELAVLAQQCEEQTSTVTDLETEKTDLEDDLGHYVCRLNATTQENLSLKSELSSIKVEKEKLLVEFDSVSEQKSILETKLEQLESEVLVLANDKGSLLAQLSMVLQEKDEVLLELKTVKSNLIHLEAELSNVKAANEEQHKNLTSQSLKIKSMLEEQDKTVKEFSEQMSALQDDCDEKSQQLSLLKQDLLEVQILSENLQKEKQKLKEECQLLTRKKCDLEEEVANCISQTEALTQDKESLSEQILQVQSAKEDALNLVETVESSKKALISELDAAHKVNEELLSKLQDKETLLSELQESGVTKEGLLSDYREKLSSLKQEKDNLNKELQSVLIENQKLSSSLEVHKTQKEMELLAVQVELSSKIESLVEEIAKDKSNKKILEKEIEDGATVLDKAYQKVKSLEINVAENATTVQELKEKLEASEVEAEQKLKCLTEMKDSTLQQLQKTEEALQNLKVLNQQQKELLDKAEKEKEALGHKIYHLQGSVDVKEDLLSETQTCVEKLREERDSLKELLSVKDKIISCQNATASSLERQSSDELDVAMKILEGELQSSQSTSEKMAQDLREVQKKFEEEKKKLQKSLEEAQSTAKSYQQEAVELKQQLSAPRKGGEIAELQQEEKMWQLDRVKHQLEFQFDTMMTQKMDLEDHLSQLQEIIKDVTQICDSLFAALPTNCDAVHEVTVMRKEVEMKLRAVDRKYADILCGIISLAHEMLKWSKTKTEQSITEIESSNVELLPSSERESIETKVTKSCETMTYLTCDVRSAINSCKFLIERCESFLKAQTRESLKIKTLFNKEDIEGAISENSNQSQQLKDVPVSNETLEQKKVANVSNNKSLEKADWFAGSATVEEGYCLMKKSHEELEKQISILRSQLEESRSSTVEQPRHELELIAAKLQDKINTLVLRPTQEQLDEKLKELHVQYSNKLETMKIKMKHIVKEEVDKVEEERRESEKQIVAKYGKRISEFEEHVQQLSAQLWKLGEKLLQEQQEHKNDKEELTALKERQRQYLMSKQRTQSLDRLDVLLQGTNRTKSTLQLKRRSNSQSTQVGLASSKVHPQRNVSPDVVDEDVSKRSTMMAPASMGLAFPEEDEDGEVFNNDYLAELKEGRCRVPLDGSRLSELQYRNSLCPPHLKSSYPLETQFHDPRSLRDDEIKGADRMRRPGKDRGTTSYKRPGPPTPSKKAGRLSLQGKEELTPRAAALREHNESQTSHGIGMLRVAKTTPSRLRALFTSSKVANATLPVSRKDEDSTAATPTSKRLSIFKRRFGGNKENQSAASGYASFR